MVSLLFIGDPHFQVGNIPEVNEFIMRLEALALDKQPDIICIAGDLLHTHERLHTVPLNKAYDLVDRMRKIAKTYVLVGNHDFIQNQQFLTENHWMNGMKEWENTVIVDKVTTLCLNDIFLVFTPYVSPGRFEEALNTCSEEWKTADCIFAHQEFFGCKMGAIVSVEGDKWPLDFPEVVSGHIHSKQRPQENIYYSGSAMQHAFGESEKNIIALLTWEEPGEKYGLEEFDLKLPRKRIVYTDVESMEDYKAPETEDKIKITISGVYDEFKAFKKTKKYRELIKSGTKVVFKPKRLQKKKKENAPPIDESSFTTILTSLVNAEKNPCLCQAYELVVNNKKIADDDVFFLKS
jgi:DNA repair exonuclease SbcCD nuclease subunit